MVSSKLLVSAFATLVSLVVVDAGPCKPKISALTTFVTDTASASFTSWTGTATLGTIGTSTATTESESTTTATENETTMTISISASSTTIASSERPTVVSNSKTTGVASSGTAAVTSSTEATTMASSTEITTGATVAKTTTTTTAADAGPTNLLINGNFDLGTTSPWYTSSNPAVRLGSYKPFQGPSYGEVEYFIDNGQAYNNYVYQRIDKSRLKAGSYQLSAMLRVDFATNNINSDGCNSMAVGCYYGDPNMLNYVKGSFVTVSAYSAADQWTPLITTCSLVEQTLSNYDYVSVAIGFSCANAIASVDAAAFQEVL